MATKLGVTQSAYCKIEKNARLINFESIETLAKALGTEVAKIIIGS